MRVERVMGMPVRVEGDIDAGRVFAWLRWVDATFSTYRSDSEISRLDRGELDDPHPAVREVLARCEELRAETGGYFDVRAGGRLDPSGYVKGWAVERAAALAGGRRFLIDAGGDVVVRGGPWRVGIRHPVERDKLCAVIEVTDGAVATSGAYERGPHILDPHTGRPAEGLLSVTVAGDDLGTADAYATAAFAMGEAGPAWTAGLAAMTISGDRVLTTPAWEARVSSHHVDDAGGRPARPRGRAGRARGVAGLLSRRAGRGPGPRGGRRAASA